MHPEAAAKSGQPGFCPAARHGQFPGGKVPRSWWFIWLLTVGYAAATAPQQAASSVIKLAEIYVLVVGRWSHAPKMSPTTSSATSSPPGASCFSFGGLSSPVRAPRVRRPEGEQVAD